MSSTFSNLKFELIANGEQSGTWGTTTNTNIGTAIEQAVVGMATLSSGDFTANVATLTLANTNAAQNARALVLNIASGAVSAAGTINVPAIQKPYIIINGSSFTVTVKVSGLTGVAVPAGKRTVVYNNGTDVGSQIDWLASLDAATATLSGNLTLSGGTANGVAYLNGSKVLTTGSALTFDGTNFGVGGAASGSRLHVMSAGGVSAKVENTANTGATYFQAKNTAGSSYLGQDATGGYLLTDYAAPFLFYINNAEQMRLTSTGLGIGTSSPNSKLQVNSGTNLGGVLIGFNGGSSNFYDADLQIWRTGNGTERMRLDSSGNLGLGVTPSSWQSTRRVLQVGGSGALWASSSGAGTLFSSNNAYFDGSNFRYLNTSGASYLAQQTDGSFTFNTAPSGTAGNAISFTQAMTLDASGNLLVGATSRAAQERLSVVTTGVAQAALFKNDDVSKDTIVAWSATTSGTNQFVGFYTEASLTPRGGITYNRGLGLTAYNTTSDYRAKDIIGPVENSGAVIDSVPVYMGKMKGATQERPMFIAHEVPAYAHTGEKDAVDAEGKPVYQQMDASTLVPVMWAEIQSLRQRLAAAGI